MNKLSFSLLLPVVAALLPVRGWAQQKGYVITGHISNTATIYLSYKVNKVPILDSARIKNNTFRFTGRVAAPVPAEIMLVRSGSGKEPPDRYLFYLENKALEIEVAGDLQHAVISGSPLTNAYKKYQIYVADAEQLMAGVSADYRNAPEEKQKDASFRKGLDERYARAAAAKETAQYQYIHDEGDPFFSVAALGEMSGKTKDLAKVIAAFKQLPAAVQQSPGGKELAGKLATAQRTSIGVEAPDFTQPGPDGKPVKLSQFRGQYVLLDFWASWCGPCRAENPNLRKVYNSYRDKSFTILGVSLDQPGKKEAWLNAVKTDSLTWTQVSDLQFWNNAAARKYNVQFLPQNFLIDPDGKIIDKNLRGEQLSEKLADIYGGL